MKTFNFIIYVHFFHQVQSKVAVLTNFTYPEAFHVFTDLKSKYANDNFPFKAIEMLYWQNDSDIRTVVHHLTSDFLITVMR